MCALVLHEGAVWAWHGATLVVVADAGLEAFVPVTTAPLAASPRRLIAQSHQRDAHGGGLERGAEAVGRAVGGSGSSFWMCETRLTNSTR